MSELWKQASVTLLSVVLAMSGFWLMIGREFVTRGEVSKMIVVESPYVNDRQVIFARLDSVSETLVNNQQQLRDSQRELTDAIRQNTSVINDLRVVIGQLQSRLEEPQE